MPTLSDILGEATAKRVFDEGWARAKVMLAEARKSKDPAASIVRRIVAEHAVEARATQKLIADLQTRVEALEQRPIKYLGVWEQGKAYSANSMVTDHGSMFIAREDTIQRPGCEAWTLCVKKGRDGKDAR